MRPGREIDTEIATRVFGHRVWAQNKILFESAEKGDRPLRNYSKEIEWATEVVKALKMTLMPTENEQWFAFVGPEGKNGWASPTEVLEFLGQGSFNGCGASVNTSLTLAICEAALKACEKRQANVSRGDEMQALADGLQSLQSALAEVEAKVDGIDHEQELRLVTQEP